MSCIDASVRIVTKFPKVGLLIIFSISLAMILLAEVPSWLRKTISWCCCCRNMSLRVNISVHPSSAYRSDERIFHKKSQKQKVGPCLCLAVLTVGSWTAEPFWTLKVLKRNRCPDMILQLGTGGGGGEVMNKSYESDIQFPVLDLNSLNNQFPITYWGIFNQLCKKSEQF